MRKRIYDTKKDENGVYSTGINIDSDGNVRFYHRKNVITDLDKEVYNRCELKWAKGFKEILQSHGIKYYKWLEQNKIQDCKDRQQQKVNFNHRFKMRKIKMANTYESRIVKVEKALIDLLINELECSDFAIVPATSLEYKIDRGKQIVEWTKMIQFAQTLRTLNNTLNRLDTKNMSESEKRQTERAQVKNDKKIAMFSDAVAKLAKAKA